jgi:hypothetical protein
LDTKIDDIDIGSPVPRERCASVVRKQSMILVDETFLPSPTAVSLLVREGPVDKRVLLLHVGRSYRQLLQAIIWLDVHRLDDDSGWTKSRPYPGGRLLGARAASALCHG